MSASSSSSSFSSRNWVFDVFPSFSGQDVRKRFLSHFLKELDRNLIVSFKDNEIKRSESLDPALKQAIRTSKIAVVLFSKNYASSIWCLNELLEIVKCKEEFGQMVIPVFYGLYPSNVRKQTGDFGSVFENTCQTKTEDEIQLWRQALNDVATIHGYHSLNWNNEAHMIEAIANDVLCKLNFNPSSDFAGFVGIEDHIAKMSVLLDLESEEVRMVGIWGSSGIGKTTIARALYCRLSQRFQGCVFIDKAFVSKSMEVYNNANQDDYNMKLHLLKRFLSEMLDKKDIKIDHLGVVEERLKNQKVVIFIDDLDDQVVLDTLVGQTHWFGNGSRIIVITKDKHFLRSHGIDHIYEVCLPYQEVALAIFCRSAFSKNYPPEGMRELASEVALRAGKLPLGLKVLGSYLRGRDKEDWIDLMPSLRNRLNGEIERTLRVSYDGLNNRKDEKIFRYIACFFNGERTNDIKLMLADSDLDVNIGLKNLIDKSLIHVRNGIVEMHCLLEDMGKEIVRAQSNEPGEREFLMDSKDICELLEDNNGTKKVLGISLDMDEIEELHIHENALKTMSNLLFLKIYTKKWSQKKQVRWLLPDDLNYLPPKLRFLRFDGYPMRYMPINFCPENLVKLQMSGSKLEKLWEGVHSLKGLKDLDLGRSKSLKELPDLSMATNLETLELSDCSSLVELPYSIQYLNKLKMLVMSGCINLKILPNGINLQSLNRLYLHRCSKLKSFPNISTNISQLSLSETLIEKFPSILTLKNLDIIMMLKMKSDKLWDRVQPLTPLLSMLPQSLKELHLSDVPSLVELPASIQNFTKLKRLSITECINLEILPTGLNFPFLFELNLSGCSKLTTFPDISTNIIIFLILSRTAIEEVPWWIDNFSRLYHLDMNGCNKLQCVSLHISKLKSLEMVDFSNCMALTKAIWNNTNSSNASSSSSFQDNFINCFNFNLFQNPFLFNMILSGEQVPSYFTHRTTGGTSSSLTNIPICFRQISLKHFSDLRLAPRLNLYLFTMVITSTFLVGSKVVDLGNTLIPFIKNTAFINMKRFHLSNLYNSTSKIKAWGIRLSDDISFPENRLGNEADEDNMVNETEHSQEPGDNNVETERSKNRISMPMNKVKNE